MPAKRTEYYCPRREVRTKRTEQTRARRTSAKEDDLIADPSHTTLDLARDSRPLCVEELIRVREHPDVHNVLAKSKHTWKTLIVGLQTHGGLRTCAASCAAEILPDLASNLPQLLGTWSSFVVSVLLTPLSPSECPLPSTERITCLEQFLIHLAVARSFSHNLYLWILRALEPPEELRDFWACREEAVVAMGPSSSLRILQPQCALVWTDELDTAIAFIEDQSGVSNDAYRLATLSLHSQVNFVTSIEIPKRTGGPDTPDVADEPFSHRPADQEMTEVEVQTATRAPNYQVFDAIGRKTRRLFGRERDDRLGATAWEHEQELAGSGREERRKAQEGKVAATMCPTKGLRV